MMALTTACVAFANQHAALLICHAADTSSRQLLRFCLCSEYVANVFAAHSRLRGQTEHLSHFCRLSQAGLFVGRLRSSVALAGLFAAAMVRNSHRPGGSKDSRPAPLCRQPTPAYSNDELYEALHAHVRAVGCDKCFELGCYAAMPVGHAVNGPGLVASFSLIKLTLDVNNSGLYKYSDFKDVLGRLAKSFEGLVPTSRQFAS